MSKEERSVERDRSIPLGVSPLSWVNEVLEDLGRGTTAQTCLKDAYHHHLMMVAETLDEISAVMAATGPSVGLLLDTGHAAAAGFDYVRLIEEFGPRTNHVHLKDVRGDLLAEVRLRDMCFNDAVRAGMFTVPGDGMVDFAPLARFHKESAYSGWLVVEAEQDPMKAPPAETVKRAFDFVNDRILQPARRADAAGGLK